MISYCYILRKFDSSKAPDTLLRIFLFKSIPLTFIHLRERHHLTRKLVYCKLSSLCPDRINSKSPPLFEKPHPHSPHTHSKFNIDGHKFSLRQKISSKILSFFSHQNLDEYETHQQSHCICGFFWCGWWKFIFHLFIFFIWFHFLLCQCICVSVCAIHCVYVYDHLPDLNGEHTQGFLFISFVCAARLSSIFSADELYHLYILNHFDKWH
jgi:hypothetical protein